MKLTLKNKKLTLRTPKLSDAPILEKYINDRLVSRWMLNVPYPYPRGDYKKWIRKSLKNSKKKEEFDFTINLENEPIGSVGLCRVEWKYKKAVIGYWLAKKYWNQGIITEALRLVLDFGFNQLKLNRLESSHFKQNQSSKRVQEKCGLRLEGVARQGMLKNGKFYDEVHRAILFSDYKKIKKKWNIKK